MRDLSQSLVVATLCFGAGCLTPNREPRPDAGTVVDGGTPVREFGSTSCVTVDPQTLDFGTVVVASTASLEFSVTNHCGGEVVVGLSSVQGLDQLLFSTTPGAGGAIPLGDGDSQKVTVQYKPLEPSTTQSQAYFSLTVCSAGTGCSFQVLLRGMAIATGLTVAPESVSFGFVPLNQQATRSFTLINIANTTLHLLPSVLNVGDGGPPASDPFGPGAGFPAPGTMLPPGQSLKVAVSFAPTSAGFFQGQLDVSTDQPGSSLVAFALEGYGGGPTISCAPTALDFGKNEIGIPETLSVLCTNVGVDVPGHPEANLRFPDPNASPPGVPFLLQDPSFQATFSRFAPPPLDGLPVGQSTQIDVQYAPGSAGPDMDTLLIASNDAANPKVAIDLTGSALDLPACNFQLLPSATWAFGRVAGGTVAVLPFGILNLGTSDCLVKNPQIGPGSNPAFTLPDYPPGTQQDLVIPPGDHAEIKVQFAPPTKRDIFTGGVALTISDPQSPTLTVPLTGISTPGCLAVLPPAIDFGVVGFDSANGRYCQTAPLTVTIWDVCQGPNVSLTNIGVFDLASPNQFVVTNDPAPTRAVGSCPDSSYCTTPKPPLTFQISFAPGQAGTHLGGIQINTGEFAAPYLIPVTGATTQSLTRTDSLTARSAKLDLLWVIDTGPAGDVATQQAVADELGDFLSFPALSGIDLQMATTSTDLDPYSSVTAENGMMEPCPGCKVDGGAMQVVTLTGGAQAAADALAPLMTLDAGGGFCDNNCNGFFEAPYEALSPPLLTGYNQAFYRADAALAIVLVSGGADNLDGVEQGVLHDMAFYYDAWSNLKGPERADRFSYSSVSRGIANAVRVADMVHSTGGVQANLDDSYWTGELNLLWERLGAQVLDYPLSGVPIATTIAVTDNGVPVPPLSPTTGDPNWSYSAVTNTIRFSAPLPPAGDALQFSYTLACGN